MLSRSENRQFANLTLPDCDPRIRESLARYNDGAATDDILKHTEYVIRLSTPVFIEPSFGWAIHGHGTLIEDSLPYTYYASAPSFIDYARSRLGYRPIIHEKRIASLRDVGEGNYYHCFNDVLPKLLLLRRHQIDEGAALLVARALYDRPFFREILQRSNLHTKRWIPADGAYILSDETLFCKAMPLKKQYYDEILELVKAPTPAKCRKRRIFLCRSSSVGRCITNMAEVLEVVERYGFESVDAAELSLSEQMSLFSEAGYVVGVHGAGLMNILFRREETMSLLEIFPPNNIPPHYYWLATIYGHRYDAILGLCEGDPQRIPFTRKLSFQVDPALLRSRLEHMLQ